MKSLFTDFKLTFKSLLDKNEKKTNKFRFKIAALMIDFLSIFFLKLQVL